MRAIRVHEPGDPESMVVETIDRPTPRASEVLVAVGAASVNPVDTYFRSGSYQPLGYPFTPGVDVAGEVVECGEDVTAFQPGMRVFGTGIGNTSFQGAYAEYARVPVDRIVPIPDGVSTRQAGAAGVVGATTWRAIIDFADLRVGETCLVHGGSGGVGHVAVQVAAQAGANTITTAAPRYHDRLLGHYDVETALDYDRPDLPDAIAAVAPDGVDVVLDHRLDDYLDLDTSVVGADARIVGIGESNPETTITELSTVRSKDVNLTLMSIFNVPNLRQPLNAIARLLRDGQVEIAVEDTYRLDTVPDAHRRLTEESFLGKLVIVPE